MRKGFTLIEMSVVLLIIGLLVAGVLLAQSLIRTSQVQTILTDVSTFQTAVNQFKQKYGVLPGDMSNATDYWGVNPNCASGGTGTGTQTCNGNGNGQINEFGSSPYEQFLVWQHLANAGFIPGQYTGTVALNSYSCSPGVNCPRGSVTPQQSYFLMYSPPGPFGYQSIQHFWDSPGGHYMSIGMVGNGVNNMYPLLTVPEAFMLDGKVDDGLPGLGVWKTYGATGVTTPNCVVNSATRLAVADGTIASESSAIYNVQYNSKPACAFIVQMNF